MDAANVCKDAETQSFKRYTPRKFGAWSKRVFFQDRERELFAHCGGRPSYAERILIQRVARNEWDLLKMDQRIDRGEELSPHAERHRFAAENRLRLDLKTLGLKGAAAESKAPGLAAMFAEMNRAERANEPAQPVEGPAASARHDPGGILASAGTVDAAPAEMASPAAPGAHDEAAQ